MHLEHINLCIPEQPKASVFYFEGLGFTRDPFFNVGASTMWCNIGYQQIHLSPGEPQVVRGHIGLVVPSLDDLKKRLVQPKVVDGLQGTKFSWSVHAAGDADARHYIRGFDASKEGYLAVTGPYGNQFRIYEATPEIAVKGNLGIVYLEELCKEGTADKIAAFYRKYFEALAWVEEDNGVKLAKISVGPRQWLVYRETDNADETEWKGHHIQIYVHAFSRVYNRLRSAPKDVFLQNNRFPDRYATLQEALKSHQFRVLDVIDEEGNVLLQLEHETRSMLHTSYMRPLVNRMGAVGIYCLQ